MDSYKKLTKEEFIKYDIPGILASLEDSDSVSSYFSLMEKSHQAKEENLHVKSKMLFLLGQAISMMLHSSNKNNPFSQLIISTKEGSTAAPSSFVQNDLDFFADIIEIIIDPIIKARLADILWLKLSPRKITYAEIAIDSYLKIPEKKDTLNYHSYLERSLVLLSQLGRTEGDIYKKIIIELLTSLNTASSQNNNLLFLFSRLLFNYCHENKYYFGIAKKLEDLADEFDKQESDLAEFIYEESIKWYERIRNEDKKTSLIIKKAQSQENRAERSKESSSFLAKSFYEDALRTYRRIKRTQRRKYNIEKKITLILDAVKECRSASIDEMLVTQIIVNYDQKAIDNVAELKSFLRNKDIDTALDIFTNYRAPTTETLKIEAIEQLEKYAYHKVASKSVIAGDGRSIKTIPSYSSQKTQEENKEAIIFKMMENHQIFIRSLVNLHIIPILDIIHLDHYLDENFFILLCLKSPFVPDKIATTLGKALFAGYNLDFLTCSYIICPIIESIVRTYLHRNNVTTTIIDINANETELGLTTLLEKEECKYIFGENLLFELQSVFSHQYSLNLRNDIAHGLLNDEDFCSYGQIYAWWLIFKLVFIFYKKTHFYNPNYASESPSTNT